MSISRERLPATCPLPAFCREIASGHIGETPDPDVHRQAMEALVNALWPKVFNHVNHRTEPCRIRAALETGTPTPAETARIADITASVADRDYPPLQYGIWMDLVGQTGYTPGKSHILDTAATTLEAVTAGSYPREFGEAILSVLPRPEGREQLRDWYAHGDLRAWRTVSPVIDEIHRLWGVNQALLRLLSEGKPLP